MYFTITTVVAALAVNVLAAPMPQIGGEAQACQNILNGVAAGTDAVASGATKPPPTKKWLESLNLDRRQLSGAAKACYDVVNNIDQGTGYAAQNIQAGAVGDTGGECTGNCAVGNAKRQLAAVANGVGNLAPAAHPVTDPIAAAGNTIDSTESSIGATAGTEEADIPADSGATIGNAVGGAGHDRRQLNKIAAGTQDVANAYGVGNEVAPVVDAEDTIDGIGTGGVGSAGGQVGGAIAGAGQTVGGAIPK